MTNHSGGGTPRTHKHSFEVAHKHDIIRCVRIEFAEQLERELAAAQSALAEKERWIPVSERLPGLEQVVLVHFASGYDGSPVYAWGARCDDSEGWLWGISSSRSGIHPKENADFNDIEADDDYKVTHWMPLPAPPASPAGRK